MRSYYRDMKCSFPSRPDLQILYPAGMRAFREEGVGGASSLLSLHKPVCSSLFPGPCEWHNQAIWRSWGQRQQMRVLWLPHPPWMDVHSQQTQLGQSLCTWGTGDFSHLAVAWLAGHSSSRMPTVLITFHALSDRAPNIIIKSIFY